jgi:hypothetical protein
MLRELCDEINALLDATEPLQAQVNALITENTALKSQAVTQQAALDATVAARDNLQTQVGALQLQNAELTANVADFSNQVSALKVANTSLTALRDEAVRNLQATQSALTAMTTSRDAAVAQVNSLTATLAARTTERDAAVSAKTTAEAALATANSTLATRTSERDAARSALTTTQATLVTRTSERDTARTDLAAANAEVTRLTKALADAQSGNTTKKIGFGSSRPSAALDSVFTNKRVYIEPGVTVPDLPAAPTLTSGYLRTVTIKGQRTAVNLDDIVNNKIRTGEIVGPQHEAEDDIEKFMFDYTDESGFHAAGTTGLDPAVWRGQFHAIADALIRNGKVGKIGFYVIMMQWSVVASANAQRKAAINAMFTTDVVAKLKQVQGGLGFDVYAGTSPASPNPVRDIPGMYTDIFAMLDKYGVTNWGVFEIGAEWQLDGSSSGPAHCDWWKRHLDYVGTLTNPPKAFEWWNRPPLVGGTGTYSIDEVPGLPDVIKAAITKYGLPRSAVVPA